MFSLFFTTKAPLQDTNLPLHTQTCTFSIQRAKIIELFQWPYCMVRADFGDIVCGLGWIFLDIMWSTVDFGGIVNSSLELIFGNMGCRVDFSGVMQSMVD